MDGAVSGAPVMDRTRRRRRRRRRARVVERRRSAQRHVQPVEPHVVAPIAGPDGQYAVAPVGMLRGAIAGVADGPRAAVGAVGTVRAECVVGPCAAVIAFAIGHIGLLAAVVRASGRPDRRYQRRRGRRGA